jgi:hypothetical protein
MFASTCIALLVNRFVARPQQLRHVCLSVCVCPIACSHVTTHEPLNGFLILENFTYLTILHIPILVKVIIL